MVQIPCLTTQWVLISAQSLRFCLLHLILDEDIPDASELHKLDISVDDIDITSDSTAVVYCTGRFGKSRCFYCRV